MTVQRAMTIEGFMAWEATQQGKHEYLRGRVIPYNPDCVAMPGALRWHHEIELNLVREVATLFEDSPFRPYTSNVMVVNDAGDAAFYPDAVILDGPMVERRYGTMKAAANPAVVFEISSPSTERYDRRHKLREYESMATMREVVLIRSDEARVERFVRRDGDWIHEEFAGQDASLPVLDRSIPLARLYKNVDLPPFPFDLPTGEEDDEP